MPKRSTKSKPPPAPDMICLRCHRRGMVIVPELQGRALCMAALETELAARAAGQPALEVVGADCPKPWHCPKCKGLNVPAHAIWCDGKQGWCPAGTCSICDEMKTQRTLAL